MVNILGYHSLGFNLFWGSTYYEDGQKCFKKPQKVYEIIIWFANKGQNS